MRGRREKQRVGEDIQLVGHFRTNTVGGLDFSLEGPEGLTKQKVRIVYKWNIMEIGASLGSQDHRCQTVRCVERSIRECVCKVGVITVVKRGIKG
jgi:hypothetical protein